MQLVATAQFLRRFGECPPAIALGCFSERVGELFERGDRTMETNGSPRPLRSDAPHSERRARPNAVDGMRRILVCLDRSPFSESCLPYAISLAKTFGSAVTLLYVMQPPHESPGLRTTDALDWEVSRQEATAYLERAEADAAEASGQHVDSRLEQGHPAERIAALARELSADLTVLGSHGEGGLTAWSLGSTVQQVLAVAKGSVLVTRSTSFTPSVASMKRILVPLDGSSRTESVLPTAARIAKANGAELLLVHVVSESIPSAILHTTEDLELVKQLGYRLEAAAKEYLEHLRVQWVGELPSVRTLVIRQADERQSLLEVAMREAIDLVVLSAHGCTCNPARPFGSVAAHLLTHSTVPLLVLQDLPELERARRGDDEGLAPSLRASFTPEPG
jgi:nucleotide-binding universal stress UspA family protein